MVPPVVELIGSAVRWVWPACLPAGFVATGLALLDILVPFDWWRPLALISAVVSLLLLILFWNRYLIAGVAIDILLLVALFFTNWTPE